MSYFVGNRFDMAPNYIIAADYSAEQKANSNELSKVTWQLPSYIKYACWTQSLNQNRAF